MDLYVAAGAKYFTALANHHDNFDNYNSKFHNWNSVNIGPKKDIVGTYTKLARERGLRVAVTNHCLACLALAAVRLRATIPKARMAGVRYDAYNLTKADGKGKWWEGYDPQELYTGRNLVMPDGIKTIAEANAWHKANDAKWHEEIPAEEPQASPRTGSCACQDLLDTYKPDLRLLRRHRAAVRAVRAGLRRALSTTRRIRDKGHLDVVVNGKGLQPDHVGAITLDIERGKAQGILRRPMADRHLHRRLALQHRHSSRTTSTRRRSRSSTR